MIAPVVSPAGIPVVTIGHAPPVIAASVGISRARDLAVGIRIGRTIATVVDDVLCQRGTRHCRGEDYSGAKYLQLRHCALHWVVMLLELAFASWRPRALPAAPPIRLRA